MKNQVHLEYPTKPSAALDLPLLFCLQFAVTINPGYEVLTAQKPPTRKPHAVEGWWISRDPLGEQGGLNLYGYVGNNPISLLDPMGLLDQNWYPAGSEHAYGDKFPSNESYQIGGHGLSDTIQGPNGKSWNAQDVADFLNSPGSGHVPGTPIELDSCYTGSNPNGLAQQLADLMGVTVLASNNAIWVDDAGHSGVGPEVGVNGGNMVPFTPRNH